MSQETWRITHHLNSETLSDAEAPESAKPTTRGAFFREFESVSDAPVPQSDGSAEVIQDLKRALESFETAALQIVVDFCEYLNSNYDITSSVEAIPSQEGWLSLRLRCRTLFPDTSPIARKKVGRWSRLMNRLLGRTLPEDVFCVDLELHVQAKDDPVNGRALRLECCLSGSEPVEVLDRNGVYREVPVLRKLRHLMQGECRRHLDGAGIRGVYWMR